MNYPTLPPPEEQEKMFKKFEKHMQDEYGIFIPPIKTWNEYENWLILIDKGEFDGN